MQLLCFRLFLFHTSKSYYFSRVALRRAALDSIPAGRRNQMLSHALDNIWKQFNLPRTLYDYVVFLDLYPIVDTNMNTDCSFLDLPYDAVMQKDYLPTVLQYKNEKIKPAQDSVVPLDNICVRDKGTKFQPGKMTNV